MRYLVISEVCERLGVEQEFVVHCIREHWIAPASPGTTELDEEDLSRLALIRELQRDFGVNEDAIPVILHLLDQLYHLRRCVREMGVDKKGA